MTVSVAVGAAAAGLVQGMSGFAFGLVALAIWAWSLDPVLAAPLVVFGSLVGQLISVGAIRPGFNAARIVPFIAGGIAGVPLGVALLHHVDVDAFRLIVGGVLILWCPAMLIARDLPPVRFGGRLADVAVGALGGVMGGMGGLSGAAPTLWTTLRGWKRDEQRAVIQSFNLSMHTITLTTYVFAGVVTPRAAQLFLVVAPAMLIPSLAGVHLYRRFSDATFRTVVLVLLAMSGVVLIGNTAPKFL